MYYSIQKALLASFLLSVPSILSSQNDTIPKTDSVLLKQIEKQLNKESVPQAPQARTAPSVLPDISVIGDFQASFTRRVKRNFDAGLHETEISFQSVVDPYARADFFITVGKDPVTGKFTAGLEEGYLTTLSLPLHLQLKAGRFKSALGRINPVHPHALPFINIPRGYYNYFGEGINDEGISLSWLVPNSAFYQDLTVQVYDGPVDNPSYMRSAGNKYLGIVHLKNFFDLTHNSTLELGLTGITGANYYDLRTSIAAMDLTFKWKPVQYNTYKSFTWQSEVWFSHADTSENKLVNTFGMYSFINYQLSKRLFFTGMFSRSNKPYSDRATEKSWSITIGWYATEFQKIEFEGIRITSNIEKGLSQILLRWIFVIGSHGAHQY